MNSQQALYLLQGLGGTVVLSLLTFLFGGIVSFIVALARISPVAGVRIGVASFIYTLQGIPLLVIMGLCYFGPSLLGVQTVSPLFAATLSMTIYSAAFLGDIWRGCLESVPKQQWEAAETLGLSRWQRLWKVILPQAARMAIPPTVGFMVQIIKNSSIASLVIGYADLSYMAKILNNLTFRPFVFFGAAAALYFIISYPLSAGSRYMERKLNVSNR